MKKPSDGMKERFFNNQMKAQQFVATQDPNVLNEIRSSSMQGHKQNMGTVRRIMAHGGADKQRRNELTDYADGAWLTSHDDFRRMRSSAFVPPSVPVARMPEGVNLLGSDTFTPIFGRGVRR